GHAGGSALEPRPSAAGAEAGGWRSGGRGGGGAHAVSGGRPVEVGLAGGGRVPREARGQAGIRAGAGGAAPAGRPAPADPEPGGAHPMIAALVMGLTWVAASLPAGASWPRAVHAPAASSWEALSDAE